MKTKKPFVMAIHWLDNDTFQREKFSLKQLALEWFNAFKRVNKRACVITFYCDVVPYWVYRHEETFKTLSEMDKIFRDGDVYFINIHHTPAIGKYDVRVYDENHKYKYTINDVTSGDYRMLRKIYSNVYYLNEELAEMLPTSPLSKR